PAVASVLGRAASERWAVVPAPTRTAEALSALYSGHAVPAGGAPDRLPPPFSHLGHEAAAILGADRDHEAAAVGSLWADGPPISVAVATGVDERLHRTSIEPAALVDETRAALERRVVPSLAVLPPDVPL